MAEDIRDNELQESDHSASDPSGLSPEIEESIEKIEQEREQPWDRDCVEIASDDSFPASDPPGWI